MTNTLSKSLPASENMALLKAGRSGNKDAMNKFIEYNQRLVCKILSERGYRADNSAYEDLFQDGCMGLFRAAKTFDFDKAVAFSTYATMIINNTVTAYMRKEQKRVKAIPEYIPANDNTSETSIFDYIADEKETEYAWSNNMIVNEILKSLPEKTAEIIRMSIYDGLSDAEIAKIKGCTRANITNLRKRAFEKIKKEYQ